MTAKSSTEIFDENFPLIMKDVATAAEKSGRSLSDITVLAATKTVSAETVNHALDNGLVFIGENKVQELLDKFPNINGGRRHFIGHLQTNKVKYIIDKVEMIESVDSLKLVAEIDKRAASHGITMDVLVEVNVGDEDAKSGFAVNEVEEALRKMSELKNIRVKGLMTIPPQCDEQEVRKYFKKMKQLFVDIRGKNIDNISMEYLSMGMSADFAPAIEEGANIVRIGTALFGARYYLRSDL